MQKHQRNAVLVAVHDKARGFFRRFGINHAAKFHALLVRAACQRLHMLFLIGHDSDGPASDARIAAQNRLSILGAIFIELAGVHDARNDLPHVILLRGVAGKNAVNPFARILRRTWRYMAKRRRIRRAHLVD